MAKINWMKIAGVVLPIAGAVVAGATNWLDEKKLDDKIAKKVAEAAQKTTEES